MACGLCNWTLRIKYRWCYVQNSKFFIEKTAFENVVCKTSAILSRPQCVKAITGIRSAMSPCLRYFENFSSHWKRQVSLECYTNRKTCLFHVHRWAASVVGGCRTILSFKCTFWKSRPHGDSIDLLEKITAIYAANLTGNVRTVFFTLNCNIQTKHWDISNLGRKIVKTRNKPSRNRYILSIL